MSGLCDIETRTSGRKKILCRTSFESSACNQLGWHKDASRTEAVNCRVSTTV